MSKVMVMDHPLIQHKIGLIRKKETGTKDFRETISEIAMMIWAFTTTPMTEVPAKLTSSWMQASR